MILLMHGQLTEADIAKMDGRTDLKGRLESTGAKLKYKISTAGCGLSDETSVHHAAGHADI